MSTDITTKTSSEDSAPRAGRRIWLGLAVLILPTLLVAVDINAVFLAMPKLSVALGATGTQQLWIADGYGFMVAGFVISMVERHVAKAHRCLLPVVRLEVGACPGVFHFRLLLSCLLVAGSGLYVAEETLE